MMRKLVFFGLLTLSIFGVVPAQANPTGCPPISYGQVWTSAQWNACFASIQPLLGYTPLNKAGDNMLGELFLATPTALSSTFNIPQGSAPSGPINGDIWFTSAGVYYQANGITVGPLIGASGSDVTSVSNSDSSLTISPTAGDVVASLNLAHTNVFMAGQEINLNAAPLPSALTGTVFQIGNTDTTITRYEADAFGAEPLFTGRRADGTAASPSAVQSGDHIGGYNSYPYDGTTYSLSASMRFYAAENFTSSHHGTSGCLATTPIASITMVDGLCQGPDNGLTLGSPTGGDKGPGTMNVPSGYYVGGNAVALLNSPAFTGAPTAPTPVTSDNSTTIPTTAFVQANIAAVSAGLQFKNATTAATTTTLNATYVSLGGVGDTLTNAGSLAAFSVDGQTPAANSRILVKNQTNAYQNGIYTLTTAGSGAVAWVLTRATDYNTVAEIQPGDLVPVETGTVNGLSIWLQTSTIAAVGTSGNNINFSEYVYPPSTYAQVANNGSDFASASATLSNLGGLPKAGGTLTGELITKASVTGSAGLNIPPGTAPSSPNNGDCWTTSAGLYCQIAGATVGPYGASSTPTIYAVQGNFNNLHVYGACSALTSGFCSTGSDTKSMVTAGAVMLADGSGGYHTALSVSCVIDYGTSGAANELDTGSQASSTWYYDYVIYNGSSVNCLGSASPTAPTLPSGYTYFARVGATYSNSSTKFLATLQSGRTAQYLVGKQNVTGLPAMASGSAGNSGTPTWVAVAVGSFVPPTAAKITVVVNSQYSQSDIIAAPNNSYGSITSSTNPPPLFTSTALGGSNLQGSFVLESTNIYWANQGSSASLHCAGWEDNL